MRNRMKNMEYWSRLKGFFNLCPQSRRKALTDLPLAISQENFTTLDQGLSLHDADRMSENVIGTFSLPFSVAANFIIDGYPVLVPMVTEEPSIVAACSKMAKIVSQNSGFFTTIDRALIKGQIQIFGLTDIDKARADFLKHKKDLIDFAKSQLQRMHERGGGIVDIEMRVVPSLKIGPMLLIEPLIDVVDAMGANIVNSLVEALAKKAANIFSGRVGLRILSNLSDQRLARARCEIPFNNLAEDDSHDDGIAVAENLLVAHAFAEADVYRACTHNKGILNGIDAVAIATGNDFRAIEAGAHAYASMKGNYQPLTSIHLDYEKKMVHAELVLPLAVGIVGGISRFHPGVSFSHKLLGDFSKTARALSSVMVSVGLSQCLSALLALSSEGIQKGHMKLHQKKLERQKDHSELLNNF